MFYPVSSVLIETLILAILEKEDSYGYEISQTIKLIATIKESTLYPILKRLEKAGLLTTYNQDFQGRRRKYYAITDLGRSELSYRKTQWQTHITTINGIIEGSIRHDKK